MSRGDVVDAVRIVAFFWVVLGKRRAMATGAWMRLSVTTGVLLASLVALGVSGASLVSWASPGVAHQWAVHHWVSAPAFVAAARLTWSSVTRLRGAARSMRNRADMDSFELDNVKVD
jgi:hypothetical protein